MSNRDFSKPEIITTIGELKKAISEFNDNDIVVVEIHEGIRSEDLYEFYIGVWGNIRMEDGSTSNEIRLCI